MLFAEEKKEKLRGMKVAFSRENSEENVKMKGRQNSCDTASRATVARS